MSEVPRRLVDLPTFLTTQVATDAQRLVAEAFRQAGARAYHFRVLAALEEFGEVSQAELGRHIGVDRSDIVAAIDELVAAGQVRREPDATDRRRNVITLTVAGRGQLRRLDGTLAVAQEHFLAPLTARDRATYRRLLLRLFAHHRGG